MGAPEGGDVVGTTSMTLTYNSVFFVSIYQ